MSSQRADGAHPIGDVGEPSAPVIGFVVNEHYAIALAAAIASLVANIDEQRELHIVIVAAGLSRKKKEKLAQLGDGERVIIEWLEPSKAQRDLLKSLPIGYVGRSCYYKIFIPDLLGPEHSRIIYLDCDVIVETDITYLWDAPLGDNYVLAVQDLLNPYVSSPFGLRNWRELERAADDELFNTGVLVLNAAKWHKENVSRGLVEYLRNNYQHVQLCDQDAMNAEFCNKWGRLDTRWNVLPYVKMATSYSKLNMEIHEALLMRANLLHYCGPSKPWNTGCRHPRRDRFFHYLDMTPWSGWRPKPYTINTDFFTYYARRVQAMVLRQLNTRKQGKG